MDAVDFIWEGAVLQTYPAVRVVSCFACKSVNESTNLAKEYKIQKSNK
ncbi:MAG: hypothetical protein ACR5KV_06305 [Wolbachia sp.]